MRAAAAVAISLLIAAIAVARPSADRRLSPPIPADNPQSAAKVMLGRRLFYDADLSIDGTMSCATCHEQRHGFGDGNATHGGVHGEPGHRNVPGLANVAWRRVLTWADPRVVRLEDQVSIPFAGHEPVEMGMAGQEHELARRLRRDDCYRRLFRAAFPSKRHPIDQIDVAKALASFERTLVSRTAPADLGNAAPNGLAIFRAKCSGCHSGSDYTDDRYHALRPLAGNDHGLAMVTGRLEDRDAFRTPSLRNVAVTGPWLHDGSATTIDAALRAHKGFDEADGPALKAFLETLTDARFLADRRFMFPERPCGAAQ